MGSFPVVCGKCRSAGSTKSQPKKRRSRPTIAAWLKIKKPPLPPIKTPKQPILRAKLSPEKRSPTYSHSNSITIPFPQHSFPCKTLMYSPSDWAQDDPELPHSHTDKSKVHDLETDPHTFYELDTVPFPRIAGKKLRYVGNSKTKRRKVHKNSHSVPDLRKVLQQQQTASPPVQYSPLGPFHQPTAVPAAGPVYHFQNNDSLQRATFFPNTTPPVQRVPMLTNQAMDIQPQQEMLHYNHQAGNASLQPQQEMPSPRRTRSNSRKKYHKHDHFARGNCPSPRRTRKGRRSNKGRRIEFFYE